MFGCHSACGEPVEGTPFGRYRLVELLGRGGMGEVWRAHDTATNNRTVAIKLLPPQLAADRTFVQRFRREADAGRGERRRPASGWASLTPTERDVVRLVSEGLGNKDIATRLFVSPRTVQSHLAHVYTKLGLTSRVQLVQEAGRHA